MNTNTNANQNQNYNEYKSTVVDTPIVINDNNDLLNLRDYRNALIKYLKCARTPITISLQGEWGCGKTSLMKSLENELCIKEQSPFLNVWINTWQFSLLSNPSDYSQAVISIMQSIIKQIADKDPDDKFSDFADNTLSLMVKGGRFVYDIAGSIILNKIGLEKEDIDNAITNFKNSDNGKLQQGPKVIDDGKISLVEQLKDRINVLVKQVLKCGQNNGIKNGFIFFIDDLDRVKPTLAVEILEVLKNIFDFDRCVFIIAIDYNVVVEGLKAKLVAKTDRDYRVYFDKLIQVQITMPIPYYEVATFLKTSLSEISFFESIDKIEIEKCIAILSGIVIRTVGKNPRSLKRVINNYSLAEAFCSTKADIVGNLTLKKATIENNYFDIKPSQISFLIKNVIFILICIQIAYPQICRAMLDHYISFFPKDLVDINNSDYDQNKVLLIRKIKSSHGLNEKDVSMWEMHLLDMCEHDNKMKPHFTDLLFVLNRLFDIAKEDKYLFIFSGFNLLLQCVSITDVDMIMDS